MRGDACVTSPARRCRYNNGVTEAGVVGCMAVALTHLAVLHKQHAEGVLAAEVEDVNVVLNRHLRKEGGGETVRSQPGVITL